MKRIIPARIRDTVYLSRLLGAYLHALESSPIQVYTKALSYDTRIPEHILKLLTELHFRPEQWPEVRPEDFHIVFSNIMFRYPTVKIWETESGELFFEM